MKDSGSQWGSHGTNQTSMGTLEHQLLFMWACPSSHQPLEITWQEPPWGLEESQQPLILETAIIPVSGCMEQPKKKKKTSFTTWQLFRSPGLAPPCLLYLAARSSSFFTNQESQANEHLLPRAVLDEIQTYTLLEFNLGDAGEGGRLSLTSKAWALPYLV